MKRKRKTRLGLCWILSAQNQAQENSRASSRSTSSSPHSVRRSTSSRNLRARTSFHSPTSASSATKREVRDEKQILCDDPAVQYVLYTDGRRYRRQNTSPIA